MMAGALAGGVDRAEAMSFANIAASVVGRNPVPRLPVRVKSSIRLAQPPRLTAALPHARHGAIRPDHRVCQWLLTFHPGHIFLLQHAAEQCDRLIVGLNSDASVRKLKGDGRPAQPAERRAATMIQLPFVDGVAIFDEDTPLELVTALQPDFIFKGGDYSPDDVVGGDVVKARGGEVRIIPTLGSHSSPRLIGD